MTAEDFAEDYARKHYCKVRELDVEELMDVYAAAEVKRVAGPLVEALTELRIACLKADVNEELPEIVDGSLLDKAGAALAAARKEMGP